MERQYIDSDISWVGKIPDNWSVLRNKNTFICRKDLVGEKSSSTQLLSLTTKGIRAIKQGETSGKVPDSYDTYQIVNPNNLVMCLFDLDCSAVFSGISPYCGMISPAYKVLSCKNIIIPKFADYWFTYVFDGRKFMHYSKNIRYSLTYDEFSALRIVVPPICEQQHIADYLDDKCGEIDSLIGLQEQMIERLKAYKQGVITEAVTKGLNPNAKLVPSGIEWTGEIPEGWKVTKIKSIAKTNSGSTPRNISGSEYSTIIWIRTTDINDDIVVDSSLHLTIEEYASASCPMLDKGACVVAMYGGGGTIGKSGYLDCHATINQALCSMEVSNMYDSKYLFCVLRAIRYYWMKFAVGTRKDPNINQEIVKNMIVPLPPLEQQQAIASYLDEKCADIDRLIAMKQQKIEKLKDYKKSVIYEAVTGKINIE